MQNIRPSVSRNGNQGGPGQARPQPISGCQSVGYTRSHTPNVGAGAEQSPRPRFKNSPQHPRRSHGGQASGPGLFGVPSIIGSPRRHAGSASTARRALTTPTMRSVTVPAAGLALSMPKCWQPAITPAMRQAAAAADERERFTEPNLEEWERPASWGHTDIALAIEG